MTYNNNLRLRKQDNDPVMRTRRAARKNAAAKPTVRKISIVIEKDGRRSNHELFFNGQRLTLREMYKIGFLGDIRFEGYGGITEPAEVEAGPIGEFEGDIVGKFVFRIRRTGAQAGYPIKAKVVKFNYVIY